MEEAIHQGEASPGDTSSGDTSSGDTRCVPVKHLPVDMVPGTSQKFCTFISSPVFKGTASPSALFSTHTSQAPGTCPISSWEAKLGASHWGLRPGEEAGSGGQRLSQTQLWNGNYKVSQLIVMD